MEEGHRERVARKVLLVGPMDSLLQVAPILSRSELEVEVVRDGSQAAFHLGQGEFEAVVVRAPLGEVAATELADQIESGQGKAFKGVVLLHGEGARPNGLDQNPSFRLVDTSTASEGEVLEAVSSILGLETRHGARLETELEIAIGDGHAQIVGVTRNVSHSGLLVETGSLPRIGTKVTVEIELPGGALVFARAETVRHRLSNEGEIRYAGLRFLTMDADSGTRWHRYIEELGASHQRR